MMNEIKRDTEQNEINFTGQAVTCGQFEEKGMFIFQLYILFQ